MAQVVGALMQARQNGKFLHLCEPESQKHVFLWQCSIVGHNWGHSEVGYLRPLHVPTSQSSCRITVSMFSTPSLQFAFSVCLWDQRKGYITFTINSNVNLMLSSAAAAWHKANKYYCFYYLPRENIRKLSSLHPPFHILPTPTPPGVSSICLSFLSHTLSQKPATAHASTLWWRKTTIPAGICPHVECKILKLYN